MTELTEIPALYYRMLLISLVAAALGANGKTDDGPNVFEPTVQLTADGVAALAASGVPTLTVDNFDAYLGGRESVL